MWVDFSCGILVERPMEFAERICFGGDRMKYVMILLFALAFLTGCGREEGIQELETEITQQAPLQSAAPEEIQPAPVPELLSPLVAPEETDFVRVSDYVPGVQAELKYATADNFTGQRIYEFEDVFLRYGTVMKLKAAAEELDAMGYSLKIWDGFRPVSAQFKLWEVCPDDTYVADPNKGYSNHSRGFAVDVTLVDREGREVEMPTGFDDFSAKADRDYAECTPEAAANARLLEKVMEKHGFSGYWGEWWHFNDTQKYDVEDCFDPGVITLRTVSRDTKLLKRFYEPESTVLTVPEGERITLLGYKEGFVMAEFWGYRGWIHMEHLA